MAEERGIGRTLVCAALGVVLAIAAPYALAAVGIAWEHIVMMALLLVCAGLLVAAFVLALVGQICEVHAAGNPERLYLLADIFLIATAGMLFICAVFAFVFGIIGIAVA